MNSEEPRGRHTRPGEGNAQTPNIPTQDDAYPQDGPMGQFGLPSGFLAAELGSSRKKLSGKTTAIVIGAIVGVLLVAYIAVALMFSDKFPPNTKIGEIDASMKSSAEVASLVEDSVAGYKLDIIGGGFSYRTDAATIGLGIDGAEVAASMHSELNGWQWPALLLSGQHDETHLLKPSYQESALVDGVTEAVNKYNETATPPTNASLEYDQASNSFVVKPEIAGAQYEVGSIVESAKEAVAELKPKVLLENSQLIQPTLLSTDQKLNDAAALASGMIKANLTLNLNGQTVGTVGPNELSSFVTVNENLEVQFSEEALNAWIGELAQSYDTIGSERSFTRPDGKQITVSGGSYGWEIDNEALKNALVEGARNGANTTIDIPCVSTAAFYNGRGQRDWGNRYADVDLSEQHVRLYGDNNEILWESDCISGAPDGKHDTGLGVWYVNNKESPSKLIGYENGKKIYETMVTYWMAFETSEIGFHDANWQPSFGGSMYAQGYGSHGCVNLPVDKAKELYGIIQIGDPVVVHW